MTDLFNLTGPRLDLLVARTMCDGSDFYRAVTLSQAYIDEHGRCRLPGYPVVAESYDWNPSEGGADGARALEFLVNGLGTEDAFTAILDETESAWLLGKQAPSMWIAICRAVVAYGLATKRISEGALDDL